MRPEGMLLRRVWSHHRPGKLLYLNPLCHLLCHPQYVLHCFPLTIWPQCYHAESMWCEAVDTEEKERRRICHFSFCFLTVMRRLLQLNKFRRTVITLGADTHAVLLSIHHWFLPLCISLGLDDWYFIVKTVTRIPRWNFGWRAASWDWCMISKLKIVVRSSYVPISLMIL